MPSVSSTKAQLNYGFQRPSLLTQTTSSTFLDTVSVKEMGKHEVQLKLRLETVIQELLVSFWPFLMQQAHCTTLSTTLTLLQGAQREGRAQADLMWLLTIVLPSPLPIYIPAYSRVK